jgi:hypothetical protein
MKPLMPGALKRAEFQISHYLVTVPAGLPMSYVKAGEAWVHLREKIKSLDVVRCVAEDGSFDIDMSAVLREIHNADGSIARRELTWRVLREWRAGGEAAAAETAPGPVDDGARYKIGWGGPAQKHRIVEASTGKVIASNFTSKDEAEAALANLMAEAA